MSISVYSTKERAEQVKDEKNKRARVYKYKVAQLRGGGFVVIKNWSEVMR
jgi:hypothetical protein